MDPVKTQEELRIARHQLILLYEIGNLMRSTLKLDEIVFLILSAITHHEGLGFNRAIMFLHDTPSQSLKGVFGVGPRHPSESVNVWDKIKSRKLHLQGFVDVYRKSNGRIDIDLNEIVKKLQIPLSHKEDVLIQTMDQDKPQQGHLPEFSCLRQLGAETFVTVPLRGKDQPLGVLFVDNVSTRKDITRREILYLSMLANHSGLAIENALIFGNVLDSSRRDSLTRLYNHTYFHEMLEKESIQSKKDGTSFGLMMIDVDDFKKINDDHGHLYGDEMLRVLSRIMRDNIRPTDHLARYGGEEFSLCSPRATKTACHKNAEILRRVIEEKGLTVSIGVAAYPEDTRDLNELVQKADVALYRAKKSGKNQVRSFSE